MTNSQNLLMIMALTIGSMSSAWAQKLDHAVLGTVLPAQI